MRLSLCGVPAPLLAAHEGEKKRKSRFGSDWLWSRPFVVPCPLKGRWWQRMVLPRASGGESSCVNPFVSIPVCCPCAPVFAARQRKTKRKSRVGSDWLRSRPFVVSCPRKVARCFYNAWCSRVRFLPCGYQALVRYFSGMCIGVGLEAVARLFF